MAGFAASEWQCCTLGANGRSGDLRQQDRLGAFEALKALVMLSQCVHCFSSFQRAPPFQGFGRAKISIHFNPFHVKVISCHMTYIFLYTLGPGKEVGVKVFLSIGQRLRSLQFMSIGRLHCSCWTGQFHCDLNCFKNFKNVLLHKCAPKK